MIIIVMGLPGSGKSFFASHFAKALQAAYLSSDQIREEMKLRGRYSEEVKMKVYREMMRRATAELANFPILILDASFSKKKYRELARELADKTGEELHFIEMKADEEEIRQRVAQSRKYSEADEDVYQKMKQQYEKLSEEHLTLNSSRYDVQKLIKKAKSHLKI
ncbi:MAG: AAA family ATPase [Cyclobacteriaceae bacterium]